MAAVLGTLRKLKLQTLIGSQRSRMRDLVISMIVWRVIHPMSKLATARGVKKDTAFSSLGEILGLEGVEDREMYEAMDWLLARKEWIERKLAERHLKEGSLVLYDVTAVYFEGRKCKPAKLRNNGKGKRNKLQIGVGLLTNREGCPVGIEVFEGNIGDPSTLKSQVRKVRERFGIKKMVLVADRGTLTEARIQAELKSDEDLDWITALRAPAIKELIEQNRFVPELFDDWGIAEIRSEEYPGERLIVCKNPILAKERSWKREELLQATEAELEKVRPVFHRLADRVRSHVFSCLLAYYVEWHMRRELAPLLFDDEEKQFA